SVTVLSNGNYVLASPNWQGGERMGHGAVTWGNGSMGTSGIVSAANSLVGGNGGDMVGTYLAPLSNGNYVVGSPYWNGGGPPLGEGAVTWVNGSGPVTGTISAANSLVGTDLQDQVGLGLRVLSNGNYVISSPSWNGGRGAVTWVNGNTGITGTISAAN